ncbi:hypothetical protein [Rhodopseudomonas sp. B29]|uniref:hypothetical protein n=1 Tax=Rhodopseudomonas sp. B29 TaxID=95607 RepID=UPI0003B36269|nr:hypothetical protein [Rhodopseudomonas sp. B29]
MVDLSDFWTSDTAKVALGGVIAVTGQLMTTLLAWLKEARFAAKKKQEDAEYLAMRLVLILDTLVSACYKAVYDPLQPDSDGYQESTVPDPTLTLPEGDYKALPRRLMYEILSIPNKLEGIKEGLAATAEDSYPPDFFEYYEYREEHYSRLGLKGLELVDTLCQQYKIPPPERPEHYTPRASFNEMIAKIETVQRKRMERNKETAAAFFASQPSQIS